MAYRDDILALLPVHYWILDGALTDSGTSPTPLTLTGSGVATVTPGVHPGNTNAAEWGRGSDNYSAATAADLDNQVTIARTVSLQLIPQLDTLSQPLVKIGSDTAGMHCFLAAGMVPACSIVSGGSTVTIFANRPLVLDQAANVVFRYDAGAVQIYIDGRLVAESTAAPVSIAASTAGTQIGGDNSASQTAAIPGGTFVIYTLGGRMSDIAVWNTALTDVQVFDTLFAGAAQAVPATATFTNVPPKTEVRMFDVNGGLVEIGTGVEYQPALGDVVIDYSVVTTLLARVVLLNVEDRQVIFTQEVELPRESIAFPADLLLNPDRVYDNDFTQLFPPTSTVPPTISGTPEVGQVLTVTDTGEWGIGTEPFTFGYQWLRDGAPIAGATASAYTLVVADDKTVITCEVTATNAEGSDSATSNAISLQGTGQVFRARVTTGGSPTTTLAALTFDTVDINDGSAYAVAGSAVTPPAGRFLVGYQAAWLASGANGRCNVITEVRKNGVLVTGSGGSGYQRDTANDALWAMGGCVVECDGTDTIEVFVGRDTDSSVGSWDADRTWLFMVSIDDTTALGHYTATGTAALGAQTYAQVSLGTTETETDAARISRAGNDITLGANGTYLVQAGLHFSGTTSRTSRFSSLQRNGSYVPGSTGYAYMRQGSDEFGRPSSFAIVQTGGTAETLTLHARGPGPGGTTVTGGSTLDGAESGIQVVELAAGVQWYGSQDATMGQNVAAASTDLNFNDSGIHAEPSLMSGVASDEVTMQTTAKLWVASGCMARRTASNGTRLTREMGIVVGGAYQPSMAHGAYNRGDQGSQDAYDSAWHARGYIEATNGSAIRVRTTETPDTGWNDGSTCNTTDEEVGFYAINLGTV